MAEKNRATNKMYFSPKVEVNSITLLKSQQTLTEFLVLQGVPHYYKNSVEKSVDKSVEISTKLLN